MKIEASDDDKLMVEKEMIEEEIMNRLLEIENKMQWIPQHCLFDCKQFIDLQSKTSKANNPNEWGEERLKQFEYIIINSRCNQFVANNIKKKKNIYSMFQPQLDKHYSNNNNNNDGDDDNNNDDTNDNDRVWISLLRLQHNHIELFFVVCFNFFSLCL